MSAMSNLPPFIAPTRFTDPVAALAQVQRIYDNSLQHLRSAMQAYVAEAPMPGTCGPATPLCACRPTR